MAGGGVELNPLNPLQAGMEEWLRGSAAFRALAGEVVTLRGQVQVLTEALAGGGSGRLTRAEACQFLRCGTTTLWELTQAGAAGGGIATETVRGRRVYPVEELRRYLRERRGMSDQEMDGRLTEMLTGGKNISPKRTGMT